MTGMNETISDNILTLLWRARRKQTDLAEALGVNIQDVHRMLSGNQTINVAELRKIAEFFHVTMEQLMKPPEGVENMDATQIFMSQVKSDAARRSLEIADKLADMILYYARLRENAEMMNQRWEP